jgi:DNA-binding response OmpR family regulator
MKLLLIEDDIDLGKAIVDGLELDGHSVAWEKEGEVGLFRAREWDWDMVILDRLLPGKNGLEILGSLRKKKSVPVLMLTALNEIEHRLEGFELGADDYLGKPFELKELLARVKALGRRSFNAGGPKITIGELSMDLDTGRTFLKKNLIYLTAAEFRTLEFMILRRGRVISRRQLEDVIAEEGRGDEIYANALDVHMHRLRSKIGKSVIQTRRGQGYLIPHEEPQP